MSRYERCGCHHRIYPHLNHLDHMEKYSTIDKRTEDPANVPEILFEVANIKKGDYYKIYISKINKREK